MRIPVLKFVVSAGLALGLSACATTQNGVGTASAPMYVDKVDVRLASAVASPRFAETLTMKTRREATHFARVGRPHTLRISVLDVHHKSAVASLLVGDGNRASARVQVVDQETGHVRSEYDARTIDTYLVNGVVGAAISATQNADEVDDKLAAGLADDVLERFYGSSAAKEAKSRPVLEVTADQPQTSPAAKSDGKPAAKAPAAKPVKREAKQAMATPEPAAAAR